MLFIRIFEYAPAPSINHKQHPSVVVMGRMSVDERHRHRKATRTTRPKIILYTTGMAPSGVAMLATSWPSGIVLPGSAADEPFTRPGLEQA